MAKTSLFDEFDAISPKAWKQKIQFELNGADFNESLLWESPEGIQVKPFYTAQDLGVGNIPIETTKKKLENCTEYLCWKYRNGQFQGLGCVGKGCGKFGVHHTIR